MKNLLNQLGKSIIITIIIMILTCVIYPLTIWGITQVAFKEKANGSLIQNSKGVVIGSGFIGQNFADPKYFHPRPSAAGAGYDAANSSGTNLGPTSAKLRDSIQSRLGEYRKQNGLTESVKVPADAVMASGSGLDPEISVANAKIQATRVAKTRGISIDIVTDLIQKNTRGRDLGFLGEPGVNVLKLNIDLDGVK